MLNKSAIILAVLFLCGIFAIWDMIATPPVFKPEKEIATRPASPAFTFQTLEAKNLNIESFKGKIILLNFWASWCTPCLAEFPDLISLSQKFPDDVIFIALSADKDIIKATQFIQKLDIPKSKNIVIGHDPDTKIIQNLFQTFKYPETYILDKNLTIARHVIGVVPWMEQDMQTYMQSLIDEPAQTP